MKPLRISWSAIRTWEECKEKSYLLRDGKRAKVSNTRNFFAGTAVDSIMRVWLDNPFHPTGGMATLVDKVMDDTVAEENRRGNQVKWRDAGDKQQVRKFCTELVNRLEPILQQHVLPYPYEHGKWFKVPLKLLDAAGDFREVVLTGEMDLITQNNGPVVWDLKGTADSSYWRKVAAQLVFYDIAVWLSTGVKTRHVGLIQPMCPERVLSFEVTDDARRDLMIRIQRYALDVWAGQRQCTTDTSKCHWCEVKHACSRFKQPTLDAFGDLAAGLRAAAGDTP